MNRQIVTVEEVAADPTNAYQITVHGDVAIASLKLHCEGTSHAWTSIQYANGGSCSGEPASWHSYVRITEGEEVTDETNSEEMRGSWDVDERDPLEAFAQDTEQWGIAYEVTFHGGTELEHCQCAWAGNLCQSKEEAENVSKRVSEALSNMIGVSSVRLFVTRVYAAPF